MSDNENSFSDENLLTSVKKTRSEEIAYLKSAITKGSWKELKSRMGSFLAKALPAIAGIQVAQNQIGAARYEDFLTSRIESLLQSFNQIPTLIGLLGGTLAPDVLLLEKMKVVLDRVITDYSLIAVKHVRAEMPLSAQRWQIVRLVNLLNASGQTQINLFESKYLELLDNHLDVILSIFLFMLMSERHTWHLIFRVIPDDETFVPEDWPATAPAGNIHSLRLKHCSNNYSDSSAELFSDSTGYTCLGEVYCHPSSLRRAVEAQCGFTSGLVGLRRPGSTRLDDGEDVEGDQAHIAFSLSQRFTLEGFATCAPENPTAGREFIIFDGDTSYPVSVPIRITGVMLPRTDDELVNLQSLFDGIRGVLLWILSGDMPVGDNVDNLRKALSFWNKAEREGKVFDGAYITPWDVADTYLTYCTVLEVLLGSSNGIQEAISGRCASILTREPRSRLEQASRIKELYALRSKFIHEGSHLVRLDSLLEIREIVRTCLEYAIEWTSKQISREATSEFVSMHRGVTGLPTGRAEQELIACVGRIFADQDFKNHCDLLRFGATPES